MPLSSLIYNIHRNGISNVLLQPLFGDENHHDPFINSPLDGVDDERPYTANTETAEKHTKPFGSINTKGDGQC